MCSSKFQLWLSLLYCMSSASFGKPCKCFVFVLSRVIFSSLKI